MKLRLLLFILSISVIAASVFGYLNYVTPSFIHQQNPKAAFVISFDDQYIDEWYAQRSLFKKYGVQATFFITNPKDISTEELRKLKELASDGHEVASHGNHHVNSLEYIKANGVEAYLDYEIISSIKEMQALGFVPVTFAYPYGANSRRTDKELSRYFYLLRGDSWKVKGKSIDKIEKIFYKYDGRRVVNGLGIDYGSGVTLQDIQTAFRRAAKNKEAVILYAHAVNNSKHEYTISPEMLEGIFRAAQNQNLASLAFRELAL